MTSTEAYTKLGQDMQLANYRPSTMKAYQRCVERFLAHYRRPVTKLREEEIRGFLLHLINEKEAGPENEKMHLAALRFFFETTLGRPEEVVRNPVAKGATAATGHLERHGGGEVAAGG